MGRVEGKVAFITGVARGQGRNHAIRLAEEGAKIYGIDILEQVETSDYPLATPDDMAETEKLVREAGGEIVTSKVDVRDLEGLQAAVAATVEAFGRLDIVVGNAGTMNGVANLWEFSEKQFQDSIDINLTGMWKLIKATVPTLLAQGEGGSIIMTSSVAALANDLFVGNYVAAKSGVSGLMRELSPELARHMIRVNTVNPGTVGSPMVLNDWSYKVFTGGIEGATREQALDGMMSLNGMPIPYIDCEDVSNAVLYLASDESRYVTGSALVVDAGFMTVAKVKHEWNL